MTSNTKILKQTIELLTGELKQVGEYRDNAVRCGVELNKQLAAITAAKELAERQVKLLLPLTGATCPSGPRDTPCRRLAGHFSFAKCQECIAEWSRAEAKGGKG